MNRPVVLLVKQTPWVMAGMILLLNITLVGAFSRVDYWLALSNQYFAPAALALALMPIIVTGGIDLSVGSVCVLASVVVGALWRDLGWPLELAIVGGLVTGFLAGLGNGLLITAGVMPLVATLATRELFRGMALTLSGDNPVTRFPSSLGDWWRTPLGGLPLSLWGIVILTILMFLVIHQTWIGRAVFAIGDNEQAARFAGLPVQRIKLGLYAWSGLVAGMCGVVLVMRYGAAKADAEKSLELLAIAGVVLGGVRITGGAGHVAGTVLGIVTLACLLAGLGNVAPNWRDTITGGLLITIAVVNEAAAHWLARQPCGDSRLRPQRDPAPRS
jgi:rhamnose transport system permease protein